jgi:hypothetical protein
MDANVPTFVDCNTTQVWKYYVHEDSSRDKFMDRTLGKAKGKKSKEKVVDDKGKTVRGEDGKAVEALAAWKCPFSRQQVLDIWRTPRRYLKTDDERTAYKLLMKYNGYLSLNFDVLSITTLSILYSLHIFHVHSLLT